MNKTLTHTRFSIRARLRSFIFAWHGITRFFKEEHNARVHLLATVVVGCLSYLLSITVFELLIIIIVTSGVWVAEIFNTVIEKIMDHISPQQHPRVRYIKDLSAAAVLITSITAVIAAAFIFIPKIL